MIQRTLEINIPVDLTSPEAIELVKRLEKEIKGIKENQRDQIHKALDGGKPLIRGKYQLKEVGVYRKVVDTDVADEKFVKTEVKPNTASIKEYQEEHGELPEGVSEVFHYDKLSIVDLEKREIAKKKRQEYLDKQKEKPDQIENPLKDIKWQKKGG